MNGPVFLAKCAREKLMENICQHFYWIWLHTHSGKIYIISKNNLPDLPLIVKIDSIFPCLFRKLDMSPGFLRFPIYLDQQETCKYDPGILQQCSKKVKTKSQKVLRTNSCVWKNYRGKTGWEEGGFCFSLSE